MRMTPVAPRQSPVAARTHDGDPSDVPGLPPEQVFTALGGSVRGLTSEEASTRLACYGPNELPAPAGRGMWRRLLSQFTDLFAVVLLIASGITFLAYGLQEPRDEGHAAARLRDRRA